MLVLSRKTGEIVDVYHHGVLVASVMLVECKGNKARIGFEAGDDVQFMRHELGPPTEAHPLPHPPRMAPAVVH